MEAVLRATHATSSPTSRRARAIRGVTRPLCAVRHDTLTAEIGA